jgi:hypothetical protein
VPGDDHGFLSTFGKSRIGIGRIAFRKRVARIMNNLTGKCILVNNSDSLAYAGGIACE